MDEEISLIQDNSASPGAPLVVLLDGCGDDFSRISQQVRTFTDADFSMWRVKFTNWNDDMTPWPSPAISKRQPDFGGCADAFLRRLTGDILPGAISRLPSPPSFAVIAGYSLAGLFALYAIHRTSFFSRALSASGSLWYPGFTDFLRQNPPSPSVDHVYISLGDREAATAPKPMKSVQIATEDAVAILRQKGISVTFRQNPGNHFHEPDMRLAQGIGEEIGGRREELRSKK